MGTGFIRWGYLARCGVLCASHTGERETLPSKQRGRKEEKSSQPRCRPVMQASAWAQLCEQGSGSRHAVSTATRRGCRTQHEEQPKAYTRAGHSSLQAYNTGPAFCVNHAECKSCISKTHAPHSPKASTQENNQTTSQTSDASSTMMAGDLPGGQINGSNAPTQPPTQPPTHTSQQLQARCWHLSTLCQ